MGINSIKVKCLMYLKAPLKWGYGLKIRCTYLKLIESLSLKDKSLSSYKAQNDKLNYY